jgi:hypothetical protein
MGDFVDITNIKREQLTSVYQMLAGYFLELAFQ